MAEEESSAWRAQQSDPGKVHGKAIGVFVTSALCLTLLEYVGMSNRYVVVVDILRSLHLDGAAAWLEVAMREQINRLTWWALWVRGESPPSSLHLWLSRSSARTCATTGSG